MKYYIACLRKYAVFRGRASRREFWYFYLYNFLAVMVIAVVAGLIGGVQGVRDSGVLMVPVDLFIIATGIPTWAVTVRRCHDFGLNPWWTLLTLVPALGLLYLIWIGVQPSQPGANAHGPNPDDVAADSPAATVES